MEKFMLKARIFGASLIALSAGMGSAMAADIPVETPAPAPDVSYTPEPSFSWTGFYVGGLAGYEWANIDADVPGDFDTDNFLGGVFTGYNFDVGNGLVLGVEGDVTYHDQNGGDGGVEVGTDWNGTLRGRIGYAMDRFMIYGTGGLAVANAEASDATSSDSQTAVGWTAGAGVETAFTNNVFGRVEYRYTDLGSDSYSLDSGDVDADLTSHAVMVGVGVKF
jgi:outer membrane immunogenic protein